MNRGVGVEVSHVWDSLLMINIPWPLLHLYHSFQHNLVVAVSFRSLLFFSVLVVGFPEEGLREESETLEYQVFTTLVLTIFYL